MAVNNDEAVAHTEGQLRVGTLGGDARVGNLDARYVKSAMTQDKTS